MSAVEPDLLWEERDAWGPEERAEWDRRESAGRYWCNSHRRNTQGFINRFGRRECASLHGGILLPCDVERDYGSDDRRSRSTPRVNREK